VIAGRIVVHDQVKHRYVVVSAGHSYMAWAPEPKGTRQDI
jgi:hypothetical protein